MQKTENGSVFYYQDVCYHPYLKACRPEPSGDYRAFFSEYDIELLKERNDWNNEKNIERCTESQIVHEKMSGTINIKDKEFKKVIKDYATLSEYIGTDTTFRYAIYCNTDQYGHELYYVYGAG